MAKQATTKATRMGRSGSHHTRPADSLAAQRRRHRAGRPSELVPSPHAPKAALTLTVHVEFFHDHAERWFRDTLPPRAFAALAGVFAAAIAGQVSDVQRVTVGDRARRNISPFFEFSEEA